ncbi:hypothetical protein [Niallia sp.]|uniref:hypothetical protein n=1 Tax=Niallia sp. TaxID=2837523 RepID=UPI0028A08A33|nr:hypothetical protein [Niallia sp.]
MNKKSIMFIGGVAIILFIGWFYIKQLSIPDTTEEKTIAAQVEEVNNNNSKEVSGTETSLSRADTQGAVTVQVTLIPEKSTSNELVFEVVMNTHTVDVLQYQIDKLAQLSFGTSINNTGNFEWKNENEDSHHLVGYLNWKGSVIEDNIILELNGIDDIPLRTFQWEKSEIPNLQ